MLFYKSDASITTLPNGNIKIVVVGSIKSNAVIDAVGLRYSTSYELTNSALNISEPWNWDHFYKYLSISGLHNCGSFQESIADDPTEMFLFNAYILNGNHFTKSCN